MRILRCHIDNFGKISDLTLDFNEGINVINQPNAWGKSTLAAFIKVMFYGLETKKEQGAPDRERNMYRPWQGGDFGGELDFEARGRQYRISRVFGKSEKFDVCHIYDLSTNLESVDYTEKVGEELFDLDGASFKRSVYIAQNDCVGSTTDAINAKLGNLAANTNDMNNYETAQEMLKDMANQMSPSRATGSIKRRVGKLTELEQELLSLDAAVPAIRELEQKRDNAIARKNQLIQMRDAYAKELQAASEESRKEEQRRTYLALCEEQEKCLEALVPYTELFAGGVPTEEEFARCIRDAQEMSDERTGLKHLELADEELEALGRYKVMFAGGSPTDEEIDQRLTAMEELDRVKAKHTELQIRLSEREKEWLRTEERPDARKPVFPGYGVVGILMVVLGLTGELTFAIAPLGLEKLIKIGAMVASALLFAVGIELIISAIKRKSKDIIKIKTDQLEWNERRENQKLQVEKLKRQESECAEILWDTNHSVRMFLENYQVFCPEKDFAIRLHELKNQTRDFERLIAQMESKTEADYNWLTLRKRVMEFYERYSLMPEEDPVEELTRLRTEAAKYRLALTAAEGSKEKIAQFEARTDMEDLLKKSGSVRTLSDINEKIHELDEELEGCRASIEQYNRQMDDLQAQMDEREEKEQELADFRQIQAEELHKYDVITSTRELLLKAKEQFTARYMAPITKAFRKYYDLLTDTQSDDWMIDANIAFHKKEHGELHEVKYMSAGVQDLVGVCMRLALVDAMYQEEKPCLILDDPFVNLDEAKTARGMELLNHVASEYQTIYFTCHSSREP